MSKFGRTYDMTVQGRSGRFYTFKNPITVIFEISIQAMAGAAVNTAHFMLYNISETTRADIQFDSAIDIDGAGAIRRSVQFAAGYLYEGYQPVIFQGNILKAFSYRDGPDVVTDISVADGLDAVQLSQIYSSRAAPWDAKSEAARIVQTMAQHGVKLGAIGTLFDKLKSTRGVMWLGSSWDVTNKFAVSNGGLACIDKGRVYLMGPNDALAAPGSIPEIDARTGLLGTPRRSGWVVDMQMIFEPRIQVLQIIKVKSSVNPDIEGTYRVERIGHGGIISDAKDGGVVTSLSLNGGAGVLNMVTPL